MSRHPVVWRTLFAVGVLLLLALTWLGVSGGVHQIPRSHTPGEWVQSVAQLAYGILSLLGVLTRFRAPVWGRPILWSWVASMALAGGLAPIVWGGAGAGVALISAGAVVLLALGIVWLVRADHAA